jgi:AcrR family transcriptional regulator
MNAAVALFARKGYAATSVREVAEAAGITKPTLYYHFGSKEGLGLAILDEAHELLEAHVYASTANTQEVFETLVGYVEAHFIACRENQELARFLYSLTFSPHESEPKFDVDQIHREIRERLKQVLDAAAAQGVLRREACDDAVLVLMGIINIYLMAFLNHGLELNRERAERAVRLFLEGVGAAHRPS